MFTSEDLIRRKKLNEQGYWEIPEGLDTSNFDFNWRPDVYERPYIHQFGTQHQKTGGPKFIVPENEGIKYQRFQHAVKLPDPNNRSWRPVVSNAVIDYSWHPDDTDPPYIYVFGNQWHDCYVMPTILYRVKGATDKKYITEIKCTLLSNKENWIIPEDIDDTGFDYSWVPNPHEPPMIHEFATQWQINGGPKYITKDTQIIKYEDCQKVIKLPNIRNWRMVDDIEDGFDFSWHPDNREPPMMYEFGTQWQKSGGPIYVVKNATHIKYCSDQIAIKKPKPDRAFRPLINNIKFDYSWHPDPKDPPYIYVFGNQWYDAETMPTLLYRVKGATEKKYVNNVVATLLPNKENWIIPEDIDDTDFDYSWVPNPNEPPFIWQFGTQHQKTGGPKYVVPNGKEVKYSSDMKVRSLPNNRNWKIIEPIIHETFDFSWHPDETEGTYNYVFGNQYHSGENMPTVIFKMKGSIKTKYVNSIKAELKIDQVKYVDSIFDTLLAHKDITTYTYFGNTNISYENLIINDQVPHVHIIDNIAAIVPKNIKVQMYDKLTDYPYVKHHTMGLVNEPLDIIFLGNGEANEEENYNHLLRVTKGLPNKVIRVKNIKGRVQSQRHAAELSNTPWYFLVNAKCKVNKNFDWGWQPNRMKITKHYIFTATNSLNGLEYGHMAVVANNKRLTLETLGTELDFTLEKPHEVLNLNSGIGIFNTSTWDTWRTAFREVIKLKHNVETSIDNESQNRLNIWLSTASGDYAEWAIVGAKDAVNYYNEVNGDFAKIKLSYEWDWLYTKFLSKYK